MILTGAALVGGSLLLGTVARRARRPKPTLATTLRPIPTAAYWETARKHVAVSQRSLALGGLAVGGSALLLASANGYTPLVLARQLATTLQNSRYGPLIYIAADTIRPLTFFPDSLITLISGLIFGPVQGVVISYIGFGTSALVAYHVGRTLRRASSAPVAVRTPQDISAGDAASEPKAGFQGIEPLLKRYGAKMQEQPFLSMVLMHGMFLHADAVNGLAGYLGLEVRPFLSGAMIGVLPALTANVLAGASLHGTLATGVLHFNPAILAASGVIMVGSLGVTRYLQQRSTQPSKCISPIPKEQFS